MRPALALALLLAPAAFAAKAFPPPPRDWVHNEGVLSPAAESALTVRLEALHQQTGRQFVVGAFKSLEGESLEEWTNRLFREWRIGEARRDDGLLFCLYLEDRKWRVEVGYGLEGVVTDLEAGRVAREQGTPHFKAGDFDAGVVAVVDGLSAIVRGEARVPPVETPSAQADPYLPLFLILAFVFVVLSIFRAPRRRRTWIGHSGYSSGWDWGGGGGGGGFSGGGGSSGGGGASGGW